jgi:TonB family protein
MAAGERPGRRPLRTWLAYIGLSSGLCFLVVESLPPLGTSGASGGATETGQRVLLRVSQPTTALADLKPETPEPPPEEPEVEPPDEGQIVDVPEPTEQVRPEESEYLAEFDRDVPEETRSEQFRINPEVRADVFSPEDRIQESELKDLEQDEPSTGAQIGNNRFDPDEHGEMAALPSPYSETNLEGLERPVPGGALAAELSGSPGNDLVREETSDALKLKTQTLPGAGYINRIKNLVSYYWSQNLDNLPDSVIFAKPQYTTVVDVVLDGNGSLESITVRAASGSAPLDNAVVKAFRVAGPFPNPPEQLISDEGRVVLPEMHWTVELGQARAPYMGVDPRAGVQFPGILKAPR